MASPWLTAEHKGWQCDPSRDSLLNRHRDSLLNPRGKEYLAVVEVVQGVARHKTYSDCWIKFVCIAGLLVTGLPAFSQIDEPILTKSARVFAPASGSLKLDYAGSIVHMSTSSQIIPEFTLQEGLTKRVEGILRFPVLRFQPASGHAVIAGGQIAIGGKYLLIGGPDSNAAISVQGVVEAPTGDSRVVGNATQVMSAILADWHLTRHLVAYTNVAWDSSFGGTGRRMSFVGYDTALALAGPHHLIPAIEFAGSTNTGNGRTQAVIQPDLLFRKGTHLEFKLGLPTGLNSISPTLGIHAQLAILWGES
jgi:hypothetical protein